MKKRFKQKVTSIIGVIGLALGTYVAAVSYFKDGSIDIQNSLIFAGVGLFLLFAEDDLINQITLGLTKKFLK